MRRTLRLPVLLTVIPIRVTVAFFVTLARETWQAFRYAWFDAVWELKDALRGRRS
jgi:hypothetical protein